MSDSSIIVSSLPSHPQPVSNDVLDREAALARYDNLSPSTRKQYQNSQINFILYLLEQEPLLIADELNQQLSEANLQYPRKIISAFF